MLGLEAVGKTWPAFLRIADVDEDRGEGGREAGSMGRWQDAREGGLLRPSTSHRLSRNADLKIPKPVDMSVLLPRNS